MSPVQSDEEDLTRKQRREQARAQRKALEQAEAASAVRRQRLIRVGGIVLAAVVVAVVLIADSGGGSSHKTTARSSSSGESGLLTTPAPWAPQYAGLQSRVQSFGFPTQSDTGYHVHAVLHIYVEGKQIVVPAKIGIVASEEYLAPLHTHDTSGIIHIESSQPYPFKLGQFFSVWGVKFTNTQLGGYVAGQGKVLSVYVNGKQVPNPAEYVMNGHDLIVVGYGKPGSFPTSFHYTFEGGL
jgi:hypothetical protein